MLMFLCACSSINAQDNSSDEQQDFYVLLSNLLKLNSMDYTYTDSDGKKHPDRLKAFKDLERIYIKNIEADMPNEMFSSKRLKIVMYFSYYSKISNSAALLEYLAADLKPIYSANKETFLEILRELPFLLPSNCERLGAYFGHEGKNEEKEKQFVKNNKSIFSKYLGVEQASQCIKYIHSDN